MTEISRRKFIQLTVVGSAVAASGCEVRPLSRYSPGLYRAEVTGQYGGYDNRVYPYLNQPDGLMDGVPQYFATVCQMCPAGCGLLVRTMGGRALKIEGNPAHPVSRGGSCARGQAALQHLYNPDRLRRPALHEKRGLTFTRDRDKDANPPDGRATITEVSATPTDWETALGRVTKGLQSASGRTAILADAQEFGHSPTQMRLIREFAGAMGATVFTYSLLDDAPWRAAAQTIYGKDQVPAYQLDQADLIVSFGGDFLEAWPSPVYYGRLFGEFRQGPRRSQGGHGRFIYIGPRMSMTAAKADLWLPCNPGTEAVLASAISAALGSAGTSIAQAASASGLTEAQIQGVADEMRRAGPRTVAVPGNGLMSANATAAFTAVEALNTLVGSQCIGFGTAGIAIPAPNSGGARGGAGLSGVQHLIQAMQAGQVEVLLILGQPNPVFTLPTATGFAEALVKVPFVAALTPFEDETTAHADVVLPTRSFLEDWGDHVPPVIPPGVRLATLRQPIIDPQFVGGHGQVQDHKIFQPWMDTRPLGGLLTDLAGRMGKALTDADTRAAVRRTWAGLGQADLAADTTENDTVWVGALATGGTWTTGAATPTTGRAAAMPSPTVPAAPVAGTFALHLYPNIYNHDGRHANLGWMQENPDPMTMAVWNSWVEINMEVAHSLGIRTGDIVRISNGSGRFIEVPAVPYPGLHPQVVAMPIGQGHEVYGRNAAGRGKNPLAILDPTADAQTGALAYGATTVTLKKVADAKDGYDPHGSTLVLAQDRPGGGEPDAVKNLIHTTAKEWKKAPAQVKGAPKANGSIFKRAPGTADTPGEPGAAE